MATFFTNCYQLYTLKNSRQPREAGSRRKAFPGGVHTNWLSADSPENKPTGGIIWTKWMVLSNVCVCTCLNVFYIIKCSRKKIWTETLSLTFSRKLSKPWGMSPPAIVIMSSKGHHSQHRCLPLPWKTGMGMGTLPEKISVFPQSPTKREPWKKKSGFYLFFPSQVRACYW